MLPEQFLKGTAIKFLKKKKKKRRNVVLRITMQLAVHFETFKLINNNS